MASATASGLEVHEAPRVAPSGEGKLAAGNVVTVEPGVYVPGRFGVRIEDLVVVGADGPRVLTSVSQGADGRLGGAPDQAPSRVSVPMVGKSQES